MPKRSTTDLRVEHLSVRLGGHLVLREVSFVLAAHKTMVVLGASGCGKTTLLRSIAGLIVIDDGRILLDGEQLGAFSANNRRIVYLNQEPLLFPHLNLFENIAFGLRLRRLAEPHIRERVADLVACLELTGLERRYPQALSGGQRQRVAFGRALAVDPALLLLDEPFSNLDPETRATMQDLFKQVARERGISALFVTHDLKESLRIGDTYAILHGGCLRTFDDRRAFCADPGSGVGGEMAFWSRVASKDGEQA